MSKEASTDESYTLSAEAKAELGLADCKVGDEYTITVTKVNDDDSLEVTVENESATEDAAETGEEMPVKNKAMAKAMAQ